MEGGFIAIITKLVEEGILAESTILAVILVSLVWAYHYVAKPLLTKVSETVTKKDLDESLDKHFAKEKIDIEELKKSLDKLTDLIDEIEDLDKDSYKEVKQLSSDLEYVKQVLSQIQGHLTFGGRRSGDFGNRELK